MDRAAAYRAAVEAYRQYAIDHGCVRVEEREHETFTAAMRRAETEGPESRLEDRLKGKDRPTEAAELENLQVPNRATEHDGPMRDRTSDLTRGVRPSTVAHVTQDHGRVVDLVQQPHRFQRGGSGHRRLLVRDHGVEVCSDAGVD